MYLYTLIYTTVDKFVYKKANLWISKITKIVYTSVYNFDFWLI